MQLRNFSGRAVRYLQLYVCIFLSVASLVYQATPQRATAASATATVVLTTSVVGAGTINRSPNKQEYNQDEVVTLSAAPSPGWALEKWEVSTSSIENWWDDDWDYRVPVDVDANGYARHEMPVEMQLDFEPLLDAVGATAGLNVDSLRIIEIDGDGAVVDANVPFQFDAISGFDPSTKPEGTLVFLMTGTTAQNASRSYHLYFDTLDKSFSPLSGTDRVVVSNGNDQGQSTFRIETDNADYHYQKDAGGFSSLDDVDGNDWIDFNSGSGASGEFRGIPNMVFTLNDPDASFFHPGFTNSTSQLNADGPVRATITSTSSDGLWRVRWSFFPTFALMTVLKAEHGYWFLYEGTPGGVLEPNVDFVVRPTTSGITQTLASVQWSGDLYQEEWAYFADPNVGSVGRALYVAQTSDDTLLDSYRAMDGAMTVFGFGRQGVAGLLTGTQRSFVIGLMDEIDPADALAIIQGAYKSVATQFGDAEARNDELNQLPPNSPIQITMNTAKAVTAYFTKLDYSVEVLPDEPERGSVSVSPQGPYDYGDEVTLSATPNPGWEFSHWSGDLSGDGNPATLLVDDDKTVTAVFVETEANLELTIVGQGQVVRNPLPPYVLGQTVTISAESDAEWLFVGWDGDYQGAENPADVTLDADKLITATFVPVHTLSTTVDGPGTVVKTPTRFPDILSDGRYVEETVVSLQAVPGEGALFAGWSGDLSGAEAVKELVMDADKAVQALFQAVYRLSTQSIGAGVISVTPAKSHLTLESGEFVAGTQVTIEAQPAFGWTLQAWGGDVTGSKNPLVTTISNDTSVIATFVPEVNLTAGQNSGSGAVYITVDGEENEFVSGATAKFAQGTNVELQAIPAAGWRFVRWVGANTSSDNPLNVVLSGSATIAAVFEPVLFTVYLPVAR